MRKIALSFFFFSLFIGSFLSARSSWVKFKGEWTSSRSVYLYSIDFDGQIGSMFKTIHRNVRARTNKKLTILMPVGSERILSERTRVICYAEKQPFDKKQCIERYLGKINHDVAIALLEEDLDAIESYLMRHGYQCLHRGQEGDK